jgi:phosphohistidine phosphatase
MQRALWLIRHAQAQNVQGIRQTDAQRQLTSQGLANVEQLQAHLQNHSDPPAQWLWVSPATRTQQTAQPLAAVWQAEIISEPTLYLARADTILDCLKGTPDHCESCAVVGHNPGISDLAHLLNKAGQTQTDYFNLPTLGMVRLSFTGSWHDLRPASCEQQGCWQPQPEDHK